MTAFPSSQVQISLLGSERRQTSLRSGGSSWGELASKWRWRKQIFSIGKRTARESPSKKTDLHETGWRGSPKTKLTGSPTLRSGGELWIQRLLQQADLKQKSRDPQCITGPIILARRGESTAGIPWLTSDYCSQECLSPLLFSIAQSL